MGRARRTAATTAGDREAVALAATLGGELRDARRSRRMRIADLGKRVGLSSSRLSEVELGRGGRLPLAMWIRLGIAVDRPLAVRLTGPIQAERLADAGHLEMQEWTLRVARRRAWRAGLEVPTRPLDPKHSADVVVRAAGAIVLIECWNTIRDFGAAVRSTQRKVAEAEALAVATGATAVRACWLVRPTAANRQLVRDYPEAIRARFGESVGWVRALEGDSSPPTSLGFVWLDPHAGLRPMRVNSA